MNDFKHPAFLNVFIFFSFDLFAIKNDNQLTSVGISKAQPNTTYHSHPTSPS